MEVLRAVEEVTGRSVPFEIGPRRAGDAPVLVANSDKLKRALGWKPRFPELTDIVTTAWRFEKNRRAERTTAFLVHFLISHTSETWQPRPLPPWPGSRVQARFKTPVRVASREMSNSTGRYGTGLAMKG